MKERIPKVTKRLSAMLAAVMALILCLGMLTFAAEITVNAPEGVTASGMGVNAYKILDLANEGTGNQATYTVTDEFADFFAGAKQLTRRQTARQRLQIRFTLPMLPARL